MEIDNYQTGLSNLRYYSDSFRQVIEDHLAVILYAGNTTVANVDPSEAYHYENDFYGLLFHKNIPSHLHWVVLRMNGMHCPTEATRELKQIYIPDPSVIERLDSTNSTTSAMAL